MERNLDGCPQLDVAARGRVAKAKLKSREHNEVQCKCSFVERKCRATQNFIGFVVNPYGTGGGFHRHTNSIDALGTTDRDRFPSWDVEGGWCTWRLLRRHWRGGYARGRRAGAWCLRLRGRVSRVQDNSEHYRDAVCVAPTT